MKKYKLGEIAEIIGGVTYDKADLAASGIRILRGGNIQNGEVCLKEDDVFLPYCYKDDKNTVQVGDTILVASTGSVEVLGKAATTFSSLGDVQIGAFLRIIRPKEDKYAAIISAYLQSTLFRKYIQKQAKGTSINNIRNEHLANFTLYIPFDNNLVLFSSFYCNLDRKIALNRSINHNLEAMAKQLYDYWFVQFDFPDENGKPYKSSGGKMVWNEKLKREIPEGWHCFRLNEIEPNIVTGKTPSTTDETNFGGAIPFITIDDIRKSRFVFQTTRTLSEKGAYSQLRKYIPIGSLCCSCIGTVGILGFVGKRGQTNQQINTIVFENEYNKEYVFFSLGVYFSYANAKVGNILPNMSKEDFCQIPLLYPTKTLVLEYHKKVEHLFSQIECLIANIEDLTTLRDLLLPLLMNGQVSVNYDLSND